MDTEGDRRAAANTEPGVETAVGRTEIYSGGCAAGGDWSINDEVQRYEDYAEDGETYEDYGKWTAEGCSGEDGARGE